MSDWAPKEHADDPIVNGLMNIAESLSDCAVAISGLLYGLKYSKGQGLSIAEALTKIAESVGEGVRIDGVCEIGEALSSIAGAIDDRKTAP